MNEYLRRIDERDYLTEREHREFLDRLNKDLEEYETQKRFSELITPKITDEITQTRNKLQKARKNAKRFKKKYLKLKEVLDALKPCLEKALEINNSDEMLELRFKAITFGYMKVKGHYEKQEIIKDWLEGEKK